MSSPVAATSNGMTMHDELTSAELSQAYRLMAADEAREAEAREWAEGACGDVADEAQCP